MFNKTQLSKQISDENIKTLQSLCVDNVDNITKDDIKRFYMNKYGNYMTSRIITTILVEFMIIMTIVNTHIDSLWDRKFPYADAIVFGTLWGIGGIYLLQMLIRTILDTYDLKLALDTDKIKQSHDQILHEELLCYQNSRNNTLTVSARFNKKNHILKFFVKRSKHRHVNITYNVQQSDNKGVKLTVYSIDDKQHDLFIMVDNKVVQETADKRLTNLIRNMTIMVRGRIGAKLSKSKK